MKNEMNLEEAIKQIKERADYFEKEYDDTDCRWASGCSDGLNEAVDILEKIGE